MVRIIDLPEEVRKKAIEYAERDRWYVYINNKENCLVGNAFRWSNTSEGHNYWNQQAGYIEHYKEDLSDDQLIK